MSEKAFNEARGAEAVGEENKEGMRRSFGYALLMLAQVFFIILLPFFWQEGQREQHFLGPSAYYVADFLIRKLFGMSALCLPIGFVFLGASFFSSRNIAVFVRKMILVWLWIFSLNMLLLNIEFFIQGRFSGLFPLFFHLLLEHLGRVFLGETLQSTWQVHVFVEFFIFLLLSFVLGRHALPLLFRLASWLKLLSQTLGQMLSLLFKYLSRMFSFLKKNGNTLGLPLFFPFLLIWRMLKKIAGWPGRIFTKIFSRLSLQNFLEKLDEKISNFEKKQALSLAEVNSNNSSHRERGYAENTQASQPWIKELKDSEYAEAVKTMDGGHAAGRVKQRLEQGQCPSHAWADGDSSDSSGSSDSEFLDFSLWPGPPSLEEGKQEPLAMKQPLNLKREPEQELGGAENSLMHPKHTKSFDLRGNRNTSANQDEPVLAPAPGEFPSVIIMDEEDFYAREKERIVFSQFMQNRTDSPRPEWTAKTKDNAENKEAKYLLEKTFQEFGITVQVVAVTSGPVITRFELVVEPGIRLSRIVNLQDNLCLALAAESVRIVAPIPGKSLIGIEIPRRQRSAVQLSDIIGNSPADEHHSILPVGLGVSVLGQAIISDLSAAPHLLVAGATGSGKSVMINSLLSSLLLCLPSNKLRFLLIDPKMVELNVYNGIPHLLHPVISDTKGASAALRWLISEMEARYKLLERYGVRSIDSYNKLMAKQQGVFARDKSYVKQSLPYIVLVIDEFADLMMTSRKQIEDSISRLAAMSRAVGIHLVLATQRPSVDVITGVIKANFPTRIAFQVSSKIDSRTILDSSGAETLLGKGDMLYLRSGSASSERLQGAFLNDLEVASLVKKLRVFGGTGYLKDLYETKENHETTAFSAENDDESLFTQAVFIARNEGKISASFLQRRLKIGYNRAARIVERMEEMGIVSEALGSKPREVLLTKNSP